MKYLLVGYGRMGRAVEGEARRRGHRCAGIVDPAVRGKAIRRRLGPAALRGAELAFEFTTPQAAASNVLALVQAGIAVVCGTTGWGGANAAVRRAARRSGVGVVVAPNFSVGMGLFTALVRHAARVFDGAGGFDPYVWEAHHRAKMDAPSGTARHLAEVLKAETRAAKGILVGNPAGVLAPGLIHVASLRAGHEPGVHTVGFDGEHEVVTLTHRTRGRAGLAAGAVLAAEWVLGRRGVFDFEEVLADLVRKGGPS